MTIDRVGEEGRELVTRSTVLKSFLGNVYITNTMYLLKFSCMLTVQNDKYVRETCSFGWGPFPPLSVDIDNVPPMPSPSVSAYCKQPKTIGLRVRLRTCGKAWEQGYIHVYTCRSAPVARITNSLLSYSTIQVTCVGIIDTLHVFGKCGLHN